MAKAIIVCIILLSNSYCVFSQIDENSNQGSRGSSTVYMEILGAAAIYSVNYEYSIALKKEKINLNARIGAGVAANLLVPLGVSIDIGNSPNFIQINFNRSFNFSDIDNSITSFGLGYVRRPLSGFYFHASIMYLIFDEPQQFFSAPINSMIWPGIGVGYSF